MDMMNGTGMMDGWTGFGWLGSLVFLVLVVALVVWLVRLMFPQNSTGSVEQIDALEVAKRRYAEGEIDKKQYESLKRDLS